MRPLVSCPNCQRVGRMKVFPVLQELYGYTEWTHWCTKCQRTTPVYSRRVRRAATVQVTHIEATPWGHLAYGECGHARALSTLKGRNRFTCASCLVRIQQDDALKNLLVNLFKANRMTH